jgi:DNA helicase-2/ATP-dependent DNA helicase PcrA
LLKEVLAELKFPEDRYNIGSLKYNISLIKMNTNTYIEEEDIRAIYNKYQEMLFLYNAVDFDDLIKLPIDLFSKFPNILEKYQKRWNYILVDEYQDTSTMQYYLMKMLAINHKNISVVGDDDQSIYSWRGANSSNLSMFERDFAPVYEVKLEQNYRSTTNILNVANSVIATNPNRKPKNLWTSIEGGEKVVLYEAESEEKEADFIGSTILKLVEFSDYKYKDIGILFRMNSQSRPLEEKFTQWNYPYKIVGGTRFFDRVEIKDITSYLRFLANNNDDIALGRIINNPKRGIGAATIQHLMEYAKEHNVTSLYQVIKIFIDNNIIPKATPYLDDFYKLIEKYREQIFKPKNITRAVSNLIEEIDYNGKLINEIKDVRKVEYRMSNLNQLVLSIDKYEKNPDNFSPNIYEYIQWITLVTQSDDNNDKDNAINMMTIHSAKGLEFKIVFVIGVEDGLLPHSKTVDESGNDEEEKRLFYVAVTRARERLYLSYPRLRIRYDIPSYRERSPFLNDIDKDLLEIIDESGKSVKDDKEKDDYKDPLQEFLKWADKKKKRED